MTVAVLAFCLLHLHCYRHGNDYSIPCFLLVTGMIMSIVSASIQMCKAIRDLVYDLSNSRHRERIRLCVDSVDKAASKLRDLLLSCDFQPKTHSAKPQTLPPDTDNSSASADSGSPEARSSLVELETSVAGAETGSAGADAETGSANAEHAIGLSGLTASSPKLNLSTSSVGSISDIEHDVGVPD